MIEHPEIPKGYYCYTIVDVVQIEPTAAAKKLAEIFGCTPEEADEFSRRKIVTKPCPYWGKEAGRPDGDNGYCTLTGRKDWENGGLLWDQVKECGINLDDEH